jgi:hypothetical protein
MKKIISIITFLLIQQIQSAIIYVNPSATGINNGTTWSNAFTNIETAFSNAIIGDKIFIKSGVYKPQGTSRNSTFLVPNGIEVYGSFNGNETSIDQRDFLNGPSTVLNGDINVGGVSTDNCYSVVSFNNVSNLTIFDGFKIINGYNNQNGAYGGGIINIGGQPIIKNCHLLANHATNGGAIGTSSVSITLINCKINNNTAYILGGGIYNNSGTIKIIDCDISNNTATRGGGVCIESGLALIDKNILSGNTASINGGATYLSNTEAGIEIYNSLIVGNFSEDTSVLGIFGPLSMTKVIKLVGNTIVNNMNSNQDINDSFLIVLPYNNGSIFRNNIITNNNAPRYLLNGNVSHCIIDKAIVPNSSSNLSSTAPVFINPHNADFAPFNHSQYNYRLHNNSSGINQGNNTFISSLYNFDLDNTSRIKDNIVDLGAYESNNLSSTENLLADNFVIYPNPVSDYIEIKISNEIIIHKITIFDSVGNKIKEYKNLNDIFDLNFLEKGFYFLNFSTNLGEISSKFIKK